MSLSSYFKLRERFSNREGRREFDFVLERSRRVPGVSAMVRVWNESRKIAHCLRSILPVFDEIVVADNGSEDGTTSIVQDIAERYDPTGKIRLVSYPVRLARFGPEHDDTPEDSLRSAVYFTNWALSQCTRRFVCKWDGDMVLVRSVRSAFASFLQDIQTGRRKYYTLTGQTVYRDRHGDYYLAVGEVNTEVEIFPYGLQCRFRKKPHWESLMRPTITPKAHFHPVAFYELKFVDEDEFAHWSTREWPSERKRREWENYHLVKEGRTDPERFAHLPRSFLDDQLS